MTHHLDRTLLLSTAMAGAMFLFAGNSMAQQRATRAQERPMMAQQPATIATYRNEKHGFTLAYPTDKFLALPPAGDSARMFVSRDGNARLLAGALSNFDAKSLRSYREFLLNASYPGAQIDYAPVRDKWFVLSGTRGNTMFYERVTFTCGGRMINSWAMLYPAADRQTYDPIIEQVHRSYRPGDEKC
jgi:hypothetical protein